MSAETNSTETIQLEELIIEVVRSTRRKRLSIEVGHGGIKARVPQTMRQSTITKFAKTKLNWIRKSYLNLPPKAKPLELTQGTLVSVLGVDYTLDIHSGRSKITIGPEGNLVIPIIESHLPREVSIKRKLTTWYKKVALQHLELRVKNRLAAMLPEHSITGIRVRDYKRRWGSCDHKGELSFNWRIVMAPEEILDYVVIHEIAHLKEFNHSNRFWKLVAEQMPNWKEQHDWLNQHGAELYRF